MRTIRPHTRAERLAIAAALVPRIRARFGDRLLALATCASVARGTDGPYSDLELQAIVKEGPSGGNGILHDGMLVEIEWTTEAEYVATCREVTADWYLAGSSRLEPLLNSRLISSLNSMAAENLESKCLAQARLQWFEVQESTAKVLNAIEASDRDALGLVAWDMTRHVLIALALLNAKSYTTFAQMFAEARALPKRPPALAELLDAMRDGTHREPERFREAVVSVYEQMEALYDSCGVPLGTEGIDALV